MKLDWYRMSEKHFCSHVQADAMYISIYLGFPLNQVSLIRDEFRHLRRYESGIECVLENYPKQNY
ncbi:MAG: hypothetical protein JWO15_3625 [Sphingomonadales bacterium]|nr:hypothetical protein [Sphingomonadales bacterium]